MAQEAVISRAAAPPRIVEWLTVERFGYGLAVAVALGVRLWGLGEAPLGPMEAAQALPAADALAGAGANLAGASPLLHALQRAIFIAFGATDATARFWPAALAGLSPLVFYFLRRWLTPGGALAAAVLWAVSPLGVWSSRLGLGDALVPTLALALLALLAAEQRGRWRDGLIGFTVGLLLASGPNAYTVLIVAGVGGALFAFRQGLRHAWQGVRPRLPSVALGLLAALILASFFLAEPAGLAAAGELPGRWLSDLIPGAGEYATLEMLARLLLNELFVVALGVAGVILALRRRDSVGLWLGAATAFALLVCLVGRGRHPADLALVALGLTLLAGPVASRALERAYDLRRERDPWLLLLVSLSLLVAAAFALPSGFNASNNAEWRTLYLGVGIATLAMTLVVWIAFGIWDSWEVVGRVAPIVLLVFGLGWQLGQMVALSYDRGAWRQSGILHELAATDLLDLSKALLDLGGLTGGGQDAAVDVAWPDLDGNAIVPMLRWQLRDRETLRVAASAPVDPARIVITTVGEQPRLAGYTGTEIGITQRWTPAGFSDFAATLRWILYRETRTAPEKTRAILWVRWPE